MAILVFQQLAAEIKKIKAEEWRTDSAETIEIVVSVGSLPGLLPVLERYLGCPLKPNGKAPSPEANQITASYGGIRKEQTLFYFIQDGKAVLAMLWPWSDGNRVTLKVFLTEIQNLSSTPQSWWQKALGQLNLCK